MEHIGIGECQTHVALWLDKRIRKLLQDLHEQGGSLPRDAIEPGLFHRIQTGTVNGVAYDTVSGQVYATTTAQPAYARHGRPPPTAPAFGGTPPATLVPPFAPAPPARGPVGMAGFGMPIPTTDPRGSCYGIGDVGRPVYPSPGNFGMTGGGGGGGVSGGGGGGGGVEWMTGLAGFRNDTGMTMEHGMPQRIPRHPYPEGYLHGNATVLGQQGPHPTQRNPYHAGGRFDEAQQILPPTPTSQGMSHDAEIWTPTPLAQGRKIDRGHPNAGPGLGGVGTRRQRRATEASKKSAADDFHAEHVVREQVPKKTPSPAPVGDRPKANVRSPHVHGKGASRPPTPDKAREVDSGSSRCEDNAVAAVPVAKGGQDIPKSEDVILREFELWAMQLDDPEEVAAVKKFFDRGDPNNDYVRQAENLLAERRREQNQKARPSMELQLPDASQAVATRANAVRDPGKADGEESADAEHVVAAAEAEKGAGWLSFGSVTREILNAHDPEHCRTENDPAGEDVPVLPSAVAGADAVSSVPGDVRATGRSLGGVGNGNKSRDGGGVDTTLDVGAAPFSPGGLESHHQRAPLEAVVEGNPTAADNAGKSPPSNIVLATAKAGSSCVFPSVPCTMSEATPAATATDSVAAVGEPTAPEAAPATNATVTVSNEAVPSTDSAPAPVVALPAPARADIRSDAAAVTATSSVLPRDPSPLDEAAAATECMAASAAPSCADSAMTLLEGERAASASCPVAANVVAPAADSAAIVATVSNASPSKVAQAGRVGATSSAAHASEITFDDPAAGTAVSTSTPSAGLHGAGFLFVHDGTSMMDAAAALDIVVGGQTTGFLRQALCGTGPIAVRVEGQNLGRKDGVVSTVQIAGAFPKVVVFDVLSLLPTPTGKAVLDNELHAILVETRIRKVMHDLHDHAVALAGLFQGLNPCINSVIDLQLVHEALGGDARNSFSDALWSFGLCDDPYRKFSVDEEVSVRRPISPAMLAVVTDGAVRLRQNPRLAIKAYLQGSNRDFCSSPAVQSCILAQKTLVSAGKLAHVFRASQMKADFATDTKCNGWRRMTFVDGICEVDETPSKILASYELQKAQQLSGLGQSNGSPIREARGPKSVVSATDTSSPGPMTPAKTAKKRSYIPPPSAQKSISGDDGQAYKLNGAASFAARQWQDELKPSPSPNGTDSAATAPSSLAMEGKEDGDVEAKITFGNLDSSLVASSTESSCGRFSFADEGGEGVGKVEDSSGESEESDARGDGTTAQAEERSPFYEGVRPQNELSPLSPWRSRCTYGPESNRERKQGIETRNGKREGDKDVLEMLKYLPKIFVEDVLSERSGDLLSGLEEVVLDQGTRPRALVRGRGKVYLCEDEAVVVTRYHINCVVGSLEHKGMLNSDNRTGFDGLLHSVGVMRNKNGTIYGVTVRVGRFAKGCADIIDDIIFNSEPGSAFRSSRPRSILVLGHRGAGKTMLIRDICRKLSEKQNVVIVDTKNELGGEGVIPHREAIGESRRVMVSDHTKQDSLMSQALRNHNPQTLVVDEISSPQDVEACVEVKGRGVRVVAGAVGDFPSVLDSHLLGAALGGLEPVDSFGSEEDDGSASISTCGTKKERRAGKPVFDVVIELDGGDQPRWTVVTRVAAAVDELLLTGSVPKTEIRAPLPAENAVQEEGDEDTEPRDHCTGFLSKVAWDSADKWEW